MKRKKNAVGIINKVSRILAANCGWDASAATVIQANGPQHVPLAHAALNVQPSCALVINEITATRFTPQGCRQRPDSPIKVIIVYVPCRSCERLIPPATTSSNFADLVCVMLSSQGARAQVRHLHWGVSARNSGQFAERGRTTGRGLHPLCPSRSFFGVFGLGCA